MRAGEYNRFRTAPGKPASRIALIRATETRRFIKKKNMSRIPYGVSFSPRLRKRSKKEITLRYKKKKKIRTSKKLKRNKFQRKRFIAETHFE